MRLRECFDWLRFAANMGPGYFFFRLFYFFQKKTGLLKRRFPTRSADGDGISLAQWKHQQVSFFFDGRPGHFASNSDMPVLAGKRSRIASGCFPFFSSQWFPCPGWHTNPQNDFEYDAQQHWTEVQDFSKVEGDIKYVWEKSRFSFLYDLIRFDFHYRHDESKLVFSLIMDWIDKNPFNCGPNWMCSQEISLRVLNWTFALFYFKNSPALSEPVFRKIAASIRDQMLHVAGNIRFSQVAVRNNHILTESLALFTTGLLFPYKESKEWKIKGKRIFEKEIAFQVDPEGSYLQHSMNYHRVVVQLLTWAIRLGELNHQPLARAVYERAKNSVRFLKSCQDDTTGQLPNYGHNDGALFFPLTDAHFRDYRPQLGALIALLGSEADFQPGGWQEEMCWFGLDPGMPESTGFPWALQMYFYPNNGYYIAKSQSTLTFLRCGAYRHRPFQADNLHLDIWDNGKNILRDAGTFQYNTREECIEYFAGTASHNTVMVGNMDQMERKSRFMWLNWIRAASGSIHTDLNGNYIMLARFEGFRKAGKWISHERKVTICEAERIWIVEDFLTNVPDGLTITQNWHTCDDFDRFYTMEACDESGKKLECFQNSGSFSEYYGLMKSAPRISFETTGRVIKTTIHRK